MCRSFWQGWPWDCSTPSAGVLRSPCKVSLGPARFPKVHLGWSSAFSATSSDLVSFADLLWMELCQCPGCCYLFGCWAWWALVLTSGLLLLFLPATWIKTGWGKLKLNYQHSVAGYCELCSEHSAAFTPGASESLNLLQGWGRWGCCGQWVVILLSPFLPEACAECPGAVPALRGIPEDRQCHSSSGGRLME